MKGVGSERSEPHVVGFAKNEKYACQNIRKDNEMRWIKCLMAKLVAVVLVCLILPRPVLAYLDPGTGSYILQLVLAGLFGAAFAVKMFWKDIKMFVTGLFSREKAPEDPESRATDLE